MTGPKLDQEELADTLPKDFTAYPRSKKGNFPGVHLCGAVIKLFPNYTPSVIPLRHRQSDGVLERQLPAHP